MRGILILVVAALALTGCGPAVETWADDAAVSRATYSHGEPYSVTVFTMVSNDTGAGGHSAMMINGSERVLYDPAGSWRHPLAPERNDMHHGFTEFMRKFYIDFHARTTYHVVIQEITITREQADLMIAAARRQGAAPRAYCTRFNSSVLRQVPGFEDINTTWFPTALMDQIARRSDVRTSKVFDDDPDYNKTMLEAGIIPIPADAFTAAN